ncbi:MAG: carbohydrate-binding domain-containing protein [Candidatus Nanoarchaeia archaeon]
MNGNGHSGNGNNGNGKVEENKIEEKQEETKIEEQTEVKTSNKAKIFDIIFVCIIIGLIIVLVLAVKSKPTEGFTELYFEDHTNLPKYSDGNLEFKYSIHNLENQDYTYYVEIAVERDGKEKEVLDNQRYELKDQETKTIEAKVNVEDYKKAKVIVSLKNKDQSIHFWTTYAKETMIYEGLGMGVMDCVNGTIKISPTDKFIIRAKGSYYEGWPEMVIYVDGKKILTQNIATDRFQNIHVSHELTKGVHYIDIMYTNDKYDEKTKADRNLYIENIWLDSRYIPAKLGVLEKGTGIKALDCEEALEGGDLYSGGALRFKVEVV